MQILVFLIAALVFMKILTSFINNANEKNFSGNKYWGHNLWFSSCYVYLFENEILISSDLKTDYSIQYSSIKEVKHKALLDNYIEIKYTNNMGEIKKELLFLNAPNIFYSSITEILDKS